MQVSEAMMRAIPLRKQFITDENGNKIGVILPMTEYLLVESLLQQRSKSADSRRQSRQKRLQRAVAIMQEEYSKDQELTSFTVLDSEDFLE